MCVCVHDLARATEWEMLLVCIWAFTIAVCRGVFACTSGKAGLRYNSHSLIKILKIWL